MSRAIKTNTDLLKTLNELYVVNVFDSVKRKSVLEATGHIEDELQSDKKLMIETEKELAVAEDRWNSLPEMDRKLLNEYWACKVAEIKARYGIVPSER